MSTYFLKFSESVTDHGGFKDIKVEFGPVFEDIGKTSRIMINTKEKLTHSPCFLLVRRYDDDEINYRGCYNVMSVYSTREIAEDVLREIPNNHQCKIHTVPFILTQVQNH
jgi:hypothetical protein